MSNRNRPAPLNTPADAEGLLVNIDVLGAGILRVAYTGTVNFHRFVKTRGDFTSTPTGRYDVRTLNELIDAGRMVEVDGF